MNQWTMRLAGLFAALLMLCAGVVTLAQESEPTPTSQPLQGEFVYMVQPGDALDLIAAFYDVDVRCLIELNELPNSGMIFPNSEVLISDTCPRYEGESRVVNPRVDANIGVEEYIIGRGDVLDIIAAHFNLDLACLMERNEIDNVLLIHAGQIIVLPSDCPPYAGLSTPRPGMIHGLLSRDASAERRPTSTPRPTTTLAPTAAPTQPATRVPDPALGITPTAAG